MDCFPHEDRLPTNLEFVQRSDIALAALATVAIQDFEVCHAAPAQAAPGFQAAVAIDGEGRQWLVQSPITAAAGAAAESEFAVLSALQPLVDQGTIPFVVPKVAGFAPLIEGGRAAVYRRMSGSALNLDRLAPGPGQAASLGRAIAAIHELPHSLAENTGHPSYSPDEYRRRHLAQLDEAAQTGRIPAFLLRRWETALENVALWRFAPVVTHGSLSPESVIMAHGQVSAIVDWTSVQVADPADDLAWVIAGAPADCVDSILEAYQLGRTALDDAHLVDRAQLLSELALVKWLQHGIKSRDPVIIADALSMMSDLSEATTETGSFTISSKVLDQGTDLAPKERVIFSQSSGPQPTASNIPHQFETVEGGALEEDALEPDYKHATPPRPSADDPTTTLHLVDPEKHQD